MNTSFALLLCSKSAARQHVPARPPSNFIHYAVVHVGCESFLKGNSRMKYPKGRELIVAGWVEWARCILANINILCGCAYTPSARVWCVHDVNRCSAARGDVRQTLRDDRFCPLRGVTLERSWRTLTLPPSAPGTPPPRWSPRTITIHTQNVSGRTTGATCFYLSIHILCLHYLQFYIR